jgi:hypothetical protein
MKNISNHDIDSEKCTKCPTCGKPSWYVIECDCGHIFCEHCSVKDEENIETDIIDLECPKCGKFQLYV